VDKLKRWGRRKIMTFKQEVATCGEEMERLHGSNESVNLERYKEVQERHAIMSIQKEAY
jgi:hypothetical protein